MRKQENLSQKWDFFCSSFRVLFAVCGRCQLEPKIFLPELCDPKKAKNIDFGPNFCPFSRFLRHFYWKFPQKVVLNVPTHKKKLIFRSPRGLRKVVTSLFLSIWFSSWPAGHKVLAGPSSIASEQDSRIGKDNDSYFTSHATTEFSSVLCCSFALLSTMYILLYCQSFVCITIIRINE